METARSREKLRQQASNVHRRHVVHGIPVINSYNTAFDRNENNNNYNNLGYNPYNSGDNNVRRNPNRNYARHGGNEDNAGELKFKLKALNY